VPVDRGSLPDRRRLASLLEQERAAFRSANPRSQRLHEESRRSLICGVPMPWMTEWAGDFPLYFSEARGNRITDVDGHTYIDFGLGDTGAMPGHSPGATVDAVIDRIKARGGITTMMPSEDAPVVGAELARRFGLPYWQFTLSATDANRFALRMCRQIQQRPYVLVFNWCYHGSVDETVAALARDGRVIPRPGSVGPQVDPVATSRVAEFNDLDSVRHLLADRQVAAVLTEPALTNVGIVLPQPGFLDGLTEACRRTGTLLVIDETHTISAGPGGCTAAWGLEPDVVTVGKWLGGGVPIGAYGVSQRVADALAADEAGDYEDWGGIGGTLAGNPLSLAAARATLHDVLTEAAFAAMIDRATRFTEGVEAVIDEARLGWCVVQLGCRAEYTFCPSPPRTGSQAGAAIDDDMDRYMHLVAMNRGLLMTPFHNMALMCPETTDGDVDRHTEIFAEAVERLFG
jgi:glutamate-1-semialdehyde 2,1-aminomutase